MLWWTVIVTVILHGPLAQMYQLGVQTCIWLKGGVKICEELMLCKQALMIKVKYARMRLQWTVINASVHEPMFV